MQDIVRADEDTPSRLTLSLGDDEQEENLPGDFFSPEFLAAYAAALEEQGYPTLARRTRAIRRPSTPPDEEE